MKLSEFSEDAKVEKTHELKKLPISDNFQKAMFDLHREFMKVDTMLRNIPDDN